MLSARVNSKSDCFKICISELNKKASIVRRLLKSPKMGAIESSVTFTEISKAYFKFTTVQGSRRVSGVSINKDTTHLFICRWRENISQLDGNGEHFIHFNDKYFRIGPITNIDESNEYLLFQCSERGYDTHEATNA